MSKNKFSKSLSWDDFAALGDPNSPNLPEEKVETIKGDKKLSQDVVRVYLERKGRGGKTVSIIKGLTMDEDALTVLCKKLKSKCGSGGAVKDGEVIIQGDKRHQLIKELRIEGFSNVKNAGA